MDNQQEAAAVVFPSRAGESDKHVLQRIHDRNLARFTVRIHEMWENVRELEDRCAFADKKQSVDNQDEAEALRDELLRETEQLKQLVREHAISPAIDVTSSQHEHSVVEVVDHVKDQSLADIAVVPMTADECRQIATAAFDSIGSFMDSRSFETTGMEVLGWSDRRKVEDNNVKFMLIKTFRGLAPEEVLNRAWRVMTSPRGMRGMYSQTMRMLIKRIQVVDEDNVLLYRVISTPDGSARAKSLFLASRFTVGDKRILMYRSIDPERLLKPHDSAKVETSSAPVESWMNIFSWNVFESRGANDEDCKFACGGIVPGTATTSAQEWLLEVLLLALRWEAKVVGAEKNLKH